MGKGVIYAVVDEYQAEGLDCIFDVYEDSVDALVRQQKERRRVSQGHRDYKKAFGKDFRSKAWQLSRLECITIKEIILK